MTDPRDPRRDAFNRIRRQRNVILGIMLAGFVVLVYLISVARMG